MQLDPKLYRKYVITISRGEPMLYVRLNKLLKSTLLFYKKLVTELEGLGFELNPYDPCIENFIVNGSHQTVCWHVDDLKISHIDPAINAQLKGSLAKIYGNKITVT